jgi:hypothetical protein
MLNWLLAEKASRRIFPVIASRSEDGTFSRSDFRCNPASDLYRCPGGKQLGTAMHARSLSQRSHATSDSMRETLPGRLPVPKALSGR